MGTLIFILWFAVIFGVIILVVAVLTHDYTKNPKKDSEDEEDIEKKTD